MLVMSLILLSGCATSGVVTDTGCLVFKPIYVSQQDELTEGTARQVLRHNETGRAVCGW